MFVIDEFLIIRVASHIRKKLFKTATVSLHFLRIKAARSVKCAKI